MFDVLYVCSANVGRSQMAETLHETVFPGSPCRSAALIEDRRAKYADGLPDSVLKALSERGLDASKNRPKLLNRELCDDAERIVLLLDPVGMTSEFGIEGTDAVEFLIVRYSHKLRIRPVPDPFSQSEFSVSRIMDDVEAAVRSI